MTFKRGLLLQHSESLLNISPVYPWMFDQSLLREKGAKRAVLEYIASQDESIPIPDEIPVDQIKSGTILRSDHWREFDDFYGIFESVFVSNKFRKPNFMQPAIVTNQQQGIDFMLFRETGVKELDEYSRRKKELFRSYCRAKGLSPEDVLSEFRIFPQQGIESKAKGTVFIHPNQSNRYVVYVESSFLNAVGFLVDVHGDKKDIAVSEYITGRFPLEQILTVSPVNVSEVGEIVDLYQKVSSLPDFQDGHSYMMEFSMNPTFVFQMRKFRKIEDGTDLNCDWKDGEGVLKTDFTFGLTPREGIVVPYFVGGLTIGPQMLVPGWNDELHQFDRDHPEGFTYRSADTDQYCNVFLPHLKCTMAGGFTHYYNHGALEDMAKVPLYFFNLKHQLDKANVPCGTMLRLFSNGREGYVKMEPTR